MKKLLVLIVVSFGFSTSAVLDVTISEGQVAPIKFALLPVKATHGVALAKAEAMGKIIESDLKSTGLFVPVLRAAFIQEDVAYGSVPQFQDWRLLRIQALINLKVSLLKDGRVAVGLSLWDVYTEKNILKITLKASMVNWRRLAHLVADQIYTRLTGEAGYFDTRIAYITEEAKGLQQKKRLAIMDQDGGNHKYLSDGQSIVLTPRFDKSLQRLVYMSYRNKVPHVFLVDLSTGEQEMLGNFPGMTFAPHFSPDGEKVIMSQAIHGGTDIYTMDLKTRRVRRLTHGPGINTSPCYSPDGENIVFNSDRSGRKNLYIMDARGTGQKRISFGGGSYATPVWSPRGDYIAFTKTHQGKFYIGLMRPDGSGERLIAQGFLVEGPSWAPNGRTLLFTRQERGNHKGPGKSYVYAIDITGLHERRIKTPQCASDGAWSAPIQ